MTVVERCPNLLVTALITIWAFNPTVIDSTTTSGGWETTGSTNGYTEGTFTTPAVVTLTANEYSINYITSTNYPSTCQSNTDCEWRITSYFSSNVVVLNVIYLALEYSPYCTRDYITIYDGYDTRSQILQRLCGIITNTQITSTGPYMTIVFHSDQFQYSTSFNLQYTSETKSDSTFTASTARKTTHGYPDRTFTTPAAVTLTANEHYINIITSSNYVSTCQSYTDCEWRITSYYSSDVVVLNVIYLTLEYSQFCTRDYITIYDGYDTSSNIIQGLCGVISNIQITSTGPYMTVVFHTNEFQTSTSFNLQYISQTKSASTTSSATWETTSSTNEGTFTTPAVVTLTANEYSINYITSTNYPSTCQSNTDCEWRITSYYSSHVVVLNLIYLDLEYSPNCSVDYITIYDGYDTRSNIIQILCGGHVVTQYTSTGPYMTVVFHSEEFKLSTGFNLQYTSKTKSAQCANTYITVNGTEEYITSPGYPNIYPSNMDCEWHITADSLSVVTLKVFDFSLDYSKDCAEDYVIIYDGSEDFNTSSERIFTLCGAISNKQYTSSGPYMTVVFHSNWFDNDMGFKLQYSSHGNPAQCANTSLIANGREEYITSPGFPNYYPSNMDCQWHITADSLSLVVLTVLDFSLESLTYCSEDTVTIYDGSSTSSPKLVLLTLCGYNSMAQFTSIGSYMTVVYHSYYLNNDRRFRLQYTSQGNPALCAITSLTANGTEQYITSPGFPNYYPSNMDCEWHITTDSSSVAVLRIMESADLSIYCTENFLTIYDGSSTSYPRIVVHALCDVDSVEKYTSSGSSMTVVFHSNWFNSASSFRLQYSSKGNPALCANTTLSATGTEQYITSPGYPNNYPSNTDCVWHITADYLSVIALNVLDLSLESSINCTENYVTLYNGYDTNYPKIQTLCGVYSNTQYTSTGYGITVVFHSDQFNNHRGFKIQYTSQIKSDTSSSPTPTTEQ